MMAKAPEIAGLSHDGEGIDRSNAGYGSKALVVWVTTQELNRLLLDCIPLPDQTSPFGEDQSEHGNRWRIERYWQGDR